MNKIANMQGLLSSSGVLAGQYALVSTGTQYLDLGVKLSQSMVYSVRAKRTGTGGNGTGFMSAGVVFGAEDSSSDLTDIDYNSDTSWIYTPVQSTKYGAFNPMALNTYYRVERNGTVVYVYNSSGSLLATKSVPQTTVTRLISANLFRKNIFTPYSNMFIGEVSECKIWSSSGKTTLLSDLIITPAGETANGAASPATENTAFDTVSGSYLPVLGSGAFSIATL